MLALLWLSMPVLTRPVWYPDWVFTEAQQRMQEIQNVLQWMGADHEAQIAAELRRVDLEHAVQALLSHQP